MSSRPEWFDSLAKPETYPHPVSKIEIIETHISWAVLTGDTVYKLKKPVDLGFANFTTLELRKTACAEELRLNRRTAPNLYEGVVPLTQDAAGPRFDGTGDILEYAVRMRQFKQADLLLNRLEMKTLSDSIIDQLGVEIAKLHRDAAVANSKTRFGAPDLVVETVNVCLDVLRKANSIDQPIPALSHLTQWVESEGKRLDGFFTQRKERGWVRECHGDMHLGNLVVYEDKPLLFDCIEFNEELRWIDVMSDIAFLVMDLQDHAANALSWRVLNVWLEQLGDFEGLAAIRFYLVYRSLVRAKVASIRSRQAGLSNEERDKQQRFIDNYLELAVGYTRQHAGALILMHGASGSGKSHVARQLSQEFGAIQIRSDVERKRLHGLWPPTPTESVSASKLYSDDATGKTYERLQSLSKQVIDAGFLAIVDAAFLRESERRQFVEHARAKAIPCIIVSCSAPENVLFERIQTRQQSQRDASDADAAILRQQLSKLQPLTPGEQELTIHYSTSENQFEDLIRQIRHRLPVD